MCQRIVTLNIYFLKGLKPILKVDVLFVVLLFGKGKSSNSLRTKENSRG